MDPILDTHIRVTDWLAGEVQDPILYTRDTGIAEAGNEMRTGEILGVVTATGEYAPWNPDATDGTQTFKGFLFTDYVTGDTTGGTAVAVLTRGPAQVKSAGIRWPDNADSTDKNTAIAAMKALGILVRQSA